MVTKSSITATVSFAVAMCEALGLNPDNVQSLNLHFENSEITVEAGIYPSREEIEKGQEAIPALKHYRLEEVENDG